LCLFQQTIVQVSIRKMENFRGILIPKPILNQLNLVNVAGWQVNGSVIEVRSLKRNPREGGMQDSERLAADDSLACLTSTRNICSCFSTKSRPVTPMNALWW